MHLRPMTQFFKFISKISRYQFSRIELFLSIFQCFGHFNVLMLFKRVKQLLLLLYLLLFYRQFPILLYLCILSIIFMRQVHNAIVFESIVITFILYMYLLYVNLPRFKPILINLIFPLLSINILPFSSGQIFLICIIFMCKFLRIIVFIHDL